MFRDEFGWVIEYYNEENMLRYFQEVRANGKLIWSMDNLKALRFARKQDAETLLRCLDMNSITCKAVEHVWSPYPR